MDKDIPKVLPKVFDKVVDEPDGIPEALAEVFIPFTVIGETLTLADEMVAV